VIKIKDTNLSNNTQLFLFILAIVLFYLLLKPLVTVFLTSIILTYVFYPVYKKLKKRLKYDALSIFATLILIIVIFLIPMVFIATNIPGQIAHIYDFAKENIIGKDLFACGDTESKICEISKIVLGIEFLEIDSIINNIFKNIAKFAGNIVASIPNIVMGIGFALFISYFLIKDGKKLVDNFVQIIPLNKNSSNKLVEQFGRVTHSVVFAHLIVAIAQGVIGTIGFFIFGVPSPLFWGVIMSIFALLPVIGPAIIWVPASIFIIINGLIFNSYSIVGRGVGLLLFGVFIISTADNILRVKLVGDSGEVHPLTVLIGLIGGVNLFGLTGIFIGPILLSLLVTYLRDFSRRYKGG